MDVCEELAGMSANVFKVPSSQHLNNRERKSSPFWKKVVVYYCVEQTVKVVNEKDIGRLHASIVHLPR